MINRFAGECACGATVRVGAGEAVRAANGRWTVQCRACRPATPRGHVGLGITFDGFVSVAPLGHLGEHFEAYKAACKAAGVRHQRGLERDIAPVAFYPGIAPAFEREGFTCRSSPNLQLALAAKAAHMRDALAKADQRMAAVEEVLKVEGRALRPYQRVGVQFLSVREKGSLLFDEPGVGKTVQTLAALPHRAPVLVFGPAAARAVWTRHVPLWRPDLQAAALDGLGSFRWPLEGELLASTWACLPKCEEMGNRLVAPSGCAPGTILVADEAHVLLNTGTLQTRRFRALARAVATAGGKTYLLTGTPVMNARPGELWALLDAVPGLAEEAFGDFPHYVGLWGGSMVEGKPKWPKFPRPAKEIPERLRRVALGRTRRDVLPELPESADEDVDVPITDKQTRLALDAALPDVDKLAIELAKLARGELLDIDPDATFGALMTARRLCASAKLAMLTELASEYERLNEPIIVFCSHTQPLDVLASRPGWGKIVGGVTATKRGVLEDEFQAGHLKGLALSIRAGGVALTLTKAAFGLFVDWDWCPSWNDQAKSRLIRIGQTRGVLFRHLVADHEVDRRVRALCVRKERVNAMALGAGAAHAVEDRIRAFEIQEK